MLRTVKFLSTFSCVSLRDMKETGAASRPVPPNHSDIRRAQVLQPPDSSSDILRGSSLIAEQSPASSHRPLQGLWYHTSTPPCVSRTFSNFFGKFPAGIALPHPGIKPSVPTARGGGRQRHPFPLLPPLLCAMIPKSGPCSGPITFLNRKESMKLIKRLFSWVFGKQLHGGDCFPRGTFHQLRNLSSCNAGNEGNSRHRN